VLPHLLIQQHGSDAKLEACRLADAMLDLGDRAGQLVWITELQAPQTGRRTNPPFHHRDGRDLFPSMLAVGFGAAACPRSPVRSMRCKVRRKLQKRAPGPLLTARIREVFFGTWVSDPVGTAFALSVRLVGIGLTTDGTR
jgi:hypothetical protein